MALPLARHDGPSLRLVVDNASAPAALAPILEVERRLAAVERVLRRRDVADAERGRLREIRELLHGELAARPFSPAVARRCALRRRWIERLNTVPEATPPRLIDRALTALTAMLGRHRTTGTRSACR